MPPPDVDVEGVRAALLDWYDRERRTMPWRALPGRRAKPYHVWLSEVMLQQTTVTAVIPYFLKFVEKWPTVEALAAAEQEEVMEAWAGLGYDARARNLHKCAKVVAARPDGAFPATREDLAALPGIGDYTSAAITAIAFDRPATVVDGNVERVVSRYFALEDPLPVVKPALRAAAAALAEGRVDRPGDFAQAMMDLGATVCTPKSPRCGTCPLSAGCAGRRAGIQADLPRRAPSRTKPQKTGYVYWIRNMAGDVLCERRPESVMLGGMAALPTGPWGLAGEEILAHPALPTALEERSGLEIRHSFTHFDLVLRGRFGEMDALPDPAAGAWFWVPARNMEHLGIPSLFKKFVRLVLSRGWM